MADRIVFIEPFSGISGDMMLGALLSLGGDLERLEMHLRRLPLHGYTLQTRKCMRAGIQALKVDVHVEGETPGHHGSHEHSHQPHRTFADIRGMIESSSLSPWVKEKSIHCFRRLAEAEGKIHNQPADRVHFHEVGAVDSIVDIVGSMIAAEELMPARFLSAPVNIGTGTLRCQHGVYPVPGPATQELLIGVPTYSNEIEGELTTPTGAAILVALVESWADRPLMKIRASGYGAGTREPKGSANVLRITVGESVTREKDPSSDEQVAVIEATIDDMSPQVYGYFQERALGAGALDVYTASVLMKKNRPAMQLTVICPVGSLDSMSRMIFTETTTIGLRYTFAGRKTLQRELLRVQTPYGPVTIKIASLDGARLNFVPEYEDCRRLAAEKGVPLKEVQAAATHAYMLTGDSAAKE